MMATIIQNYADCTTSGSEWKQYINTWKTYKTNTIYQPCTIWYDNDSSTDSIYPTYGTSATATAKAYCQILDWATEADNTYYRWTWKSDWSSDGYMAVPRSPQSRLREIIQSRQAPTVLRSRQHLALVQDPREIRARETLRRVLGEDKFRKFLKNGFTTVRAKSGLVYQIFPGHGITNVYRDGQKVERLCVVLRGNFPPTDSLIMRYLLILNDERDFRSHAVKHTVYPDQLQPTPVVRNEPLTEVYRRLKVA